MDERAILRVFNEMMPDPFGRLRSQGFGGRCSCTWPQRDQPFIWVCLKMGYIIRPKKMPKMLLQEGKWWLTMRFGVPYLQTNPYPFHQFRICELSVFPSFAMSWCVFPCYPRWCVFASSLVCSSDVFFAGSRTCYGGPKAWDGTGASHRLFWPWHGLKKA